MKITKWGVLGHKIDREVRSVIAFEICNLKSFGSFLSHFLASTALAREKRGPWGHMIFELIRTFLPSCSRTNKSWTEVKILASRILQVTLLIAESLRTFGMFCFLRDNGSVLFISLNYKTKLAVPVAFTPLGSNQRTGEDKQAAKSDFIEFGLDTLSSIAWPGSHHLAPANVNSLFLWFHSKTCTFKRWVVLQTFKLTYILIWRY